MYVIRPLIHTHGMTRLTRQLTHHSGAGATLHQLPTCRPLHRAVEACSARGGVRHGSRASGPLGPLHSRTDMLFRHVTRWSRPPTLPAHDGGSAVVLLNTHTSLTRPRDPRLCQSSGHSLSATGRDPPSLCIMSARRAAHLCDTDVALILLELGTPALLAYDNRRKARHHPVSASLLKP